MPFLVHVSIFTDFMKYAHFSYSGIQNNKTGIWGFISFTFQIGNIEENILENGNRTSDIV